MADKKTTIPGPLSWLADAPLFIDSDQLGRFYDAVVNPDGEEGTTTIEITKEAAAKLSASIGAGAKLEPSAVLGLLGNLFPFLKPSVELDAQGDAGAEGKLSKAKTIQLHPIKTPQRQLVHLALHYLSNLPARVKFGSLQKLDWADPVWIAQSPRALVFLDLPSEAEAVGNSVPETKLIPLAAEFERGIELFFEKFEASNGSSPPVYAEKGASLAELRRKRKEYWRWFDANFSVRNGMKLIEEASNARGRIHWIDYRLPLSANGETLHLHVAPGGKYDTGVLAYNFINRGRNHGLRIVGTLKSEPDMNVLAIYEK